MEAKGFKCQMHFNQPYADFTSPGARQVDYPPADIFSCIAGRTVKLVLEKSWAAIFVIVNDKVTGIATNVYLTGM
ncbi:hypothetical protein [Rhodopila sp.]|uniref:hypothetical protein n=1 Tax=Rhodopila sp. TaxID=2480087 RepID=UPI003D09EEBB